MVFKIEKCFCFRLESAVIFIAWLGIICCCIWLINLVAVLIYVSFFASFEKLNIFVPHPVFVNGSVNGSGNDSDSNEIENVTISGPVHVESRKISRIFLIVLLLIIIAITCYFLWVWKSLLFGVQERKSRYMKPYLILSAFMFLIECINILRGDLLTIPGVIISTYITLCVYTLYKNIQSEEIGRSGLINNQATTAITPNLVDVKIEFEK